MNRIFASIALAIGIFILGLFFCAFASILYTSADFGQSIMIPAIFYVGMINAVCTYLIISKLNSREK